MALAMPVVRTAPEETMSDLLATLTEPLYGIVDMFLESPITGTVTTLVLGGAVTAILVALR